VSLVARQHGVAASQLFLWRKHIGKAAYSVAAGEQVVPASELASAMKQIKDAAPAGQKPWKTSC
jgi:transposase